jgi:hypothetical protein
MAWTIENQMHTQQESIECYDEYIAYLAEQKYKAYEEMREYDLRIKNEKALREQCLKQLEGIKTRTVTV